MFRARILRILIVFHPRDVDVDQRKVCVAVESKVSESSQVLRVLEHCFFQGKLHKGSRGKQVNSVNQAGQVFPRLWWCYYHASVVSQF